MRTTMKPLIFVALIAAPLVTPGCAAVIYSESGYRQMEQKQLERERKRSEARTERDIERKIAKHWREEVAAAQAENAQAMAAQYPGWGWVAGLWCHDGEGGPVVERIKFTGPNQVRKISFSGFKRSRPTIRSIEDFTLRLNGGAVEGWYHSLYTAGIARWRQGPDGELIKAGGASYDRNTVKSGVPFSGKVSKEFTGRTVYRRCTSTVDDYLRLKREK